MAIPMMWIIVTETISFRQVSQAMPSL